MGGGDEDSDGGNGGDAGRGQQGVRVLALQGGSEDAGEGCRVARKCW